MSSRREERKTMVPRIHEVTVVRCDNCRVEVELTLSEAMEYEPTIRNGWGYIRTPDKSCDLCPECLVKVEAVLGQGGG